ncbi:MAG: hypothetical protein ACYDBH_13230 [Acidobacteriaceae bacterium]
MSRECLLANVALSPDAANAATAAMYAQGNFGEISFPEAVEVIRQQISEVHKCDLHGAESMLTAQAVALNAIFNEMARRAGINMGEHMGVAETYLRLALKAQSQCRATLETLAEIKNPRPVFVTAQQANIAQGHQQVNNGATPAEHASRAQKSENVQNKLLERNHGERLDFGAPGKASAVDSPVETVGAIHGAKVERG